jgi:hypothetical protein
MYFKLMSCPVNIFMPSDCYDAYRKLLQRCIMLLNAQRYLQSKTNAAPMWLHFRRFALFLDASPSSPSSSSWVGDQQRIDLLSKFVNALPVTAWKTRSCICFSKWQACACICMDLHALTSADSSASAGTVCFFPLRAAEPRPLPPVSAGRAGLSLRPAASGSSSSYSCSTIPTVHAACDMWQVDTMHISCFCSVRAGPPCDVSSLLLARGPRLLHRRRGGACGRPAPGTPPSTAPTAPWSG